MSDTTPFCSIHERNFGTRVPAVAKVKRFFDDSQFVANFYCKQCLREVRHQASKHMLQIEVEIFNRRVTDKLNSPT